jgi:two-component system, OmpR family, sensor histidine kinase KdpD
MTRFKNYLIVVPILLGAAMFTRLVQPYFDATNIVMVYMLTVVVVAFFLSLGPAIITCLLSVVLFDFLNLPPYMQFSRSPSEYVFTLLVMLVTAATISTLAARLRQHAIESEDKEARTQALYDLSAELAEQQTNDEIINITVRHVTRAFHANVEVLYPEKNIPINHWPFQQEANLANFSEKFLQHETDKQMYVCLPLHISQQLYALILVITAKHQLATPHKTTHLQAMLRQASLAMERNNLRQQIQQSELRVQNELLRNNILNAISHDLRTPLASIIGASSSLLNEGDSFSDTSKFQLRKVIYEESLQMQGMVENLLDMAKLQSGVKLSQEWQAIEEIVGSALVILRRRIKHHQLRVNVPDDLPLLRCDSVLMERVIINLVENAAKYSPELSVITLTACLENNTILFKVIDQGHGIPELLKERIFEPFYQIKPTTSGFGLGLTICRSIVEVHGGQITIDSSIDKGTTMTIRLPVAEDAPVLSAES